VIPQLIIPFKTALNTRDAGIIVVGTKKKPKTQLYYRSPSIIVAGLLETPHPPRVYVHVSKET
jgi:hypothetical protein